MSRITPPYPHDAYAAYCGECQCTSCLAIKAENLKHMTSEESIRWICDQIREACPGQCAEEVLTLTCSLESSVEEYYNNCEAELTLGQIVESYLSDNPEYWRAKA